MIEPEETIEAKLVSALRAAVPEIDVISALAPCEQGDLKLAANSCISVFVDLASQDLDWIGPGVPCTYSARVVLKVDFSDDKTGALFRDSARQVRGALAALTGDGCAAVSGDGFACDAFIMGSTNTALDAGDGSGAMAKTYNATVKGRFFPHNTNQEDS